MYSIVHLELLNVIVVNTSTKHATMLLTWRALSWPLVNKHSSVLSATVGAMKGQRVQVVFPILLSSRQHCIDLPGFMDSCDIGLSRLGNYQVEERTGAGLRAPTSSPRAQTLHSPNRNARFCKISNGCDVTCLV